MNKQINVTVVDSMGSDITVVNAARVSFGKQSEMEIPNPFGPPRLKAKDVKLIQYLARHNHISPFGHCFASFHVKAPVFVARQLVKHKFLRWNEISRRYVSDAPEFYEVNEWRGKSADKKQGSDGAVDISMFRQNSYNSAINSCAHVYEQLLKDGVAPEQARMVLPQSSMTEWHWSGSIDAFADMCSLRLKSDSQEETRQVAREIDDAMRTMFPFSWLALMECRDD